MSALIGLLTLSMAFAYLLRRNFQRLKFVPAHLLYTIAPLYILVTTATVPIMDTFFPEKLLPILFEPVEGSEEEQKQMVFL